ncbi:hypothetical protein JB92DRAFT_2869616 [Gautieria morchelliformis]|nr:hypothetical protein JB92DRAFT_2869616 [Gautieria morchelliformis]
MYTDPNIQHNSSLTTSRTLGTITGFSTVDSLPTLLGISLDNDNMMGLPEPRKGRIGMLILVGAICGTKTLLVWTRLTWEVSTRLTALV